MGRAMVSVGQTAQKPYYMDYAAVNVYTIEELCYCLHENAFLLNQDIVNRQLIAWIDEECGLTELARQLTPCLHIHASLAAFVTAILEYTAYYRPEEIHEVHMLLKQNENLPPLERKALYADYLLQNRKYSAAIQEYRMLRELAEEGEQLGLLYHNMGTAYAGLFLFEEAAVCFEKAYANAGRIESYRQYLAAQRMHLPEQDYIALIAEQKEAYDTSLLLEKQIEQLQGEWESSALHRQFETLALTKEEYGSQRSCALMDEMTEQIKAEYRAMVIR